MFCLIKQVFVALLSFSGSLATKYVSLSNDPCMVGPALIDLNRVELNYYPFMISLGKCNRSCSIYENIHSESNKRL